MQYQQRNHKTISNHADSPAQQQCPRIHRDRLRPVIKLALEISRCTSIRTQHLTTTITSQENLTNIPPSQAVVEDLDPGPALSTHPTTPLGQALFSAFERDYTHLTVLDPHSKALLGYISTPSIKSQLSSGAINENDSVEKAMVRFRRKGRKYALITMETPLEELEGFFEGKVTGGKEDFAVVTDPARRFVLGVATREDLGEFVRRRPA